MRKTTLWHCQIQIVYWPLLKLLEALVSVAEPNTSQEVIDLSEKLQMLGRTADEQTYVAISQLHISIRIYIYPYIIIIIGINY